MSLGPRPTFLPIGILIHAAIWPQQIWAENWGLCVPLEEDELGPHLTQCGQAEAYLRAKFHLDPSNSLATIHQCHRQTGQTTLPPCFLFSLVLTALGVLGYACCRLCRSSAMLTVSS